MDPQLVEEIPTDPQWQYEPKWDGFQAIAFRDGPDVDLRSKSGQPLGRCFPELVTALKQVRAKPFVVDGEIVIPLGARLSFDDLLQRIHPAESRVRRLASEHPAIYIVFDPLADPRSRSLTDMTLAERRLRLKHSSTDFSTLKSKFVFHRQPTMSAPRGVGSARPAKRSTA